MERLQGDGLQSSRLAGHCLSLCRKKRDLEDEEAEGASSGEDEFYDRTMETKKKRSKATAHVEDAASLYGRKVCRSD